MALLSYCSKLGSMTSLDPLTWESCWPFSPAPPCPGAAQVALPVVAPPGRAAGQCLFKVHHTAVLLNRISNRLLLGVEFTLPLIMEGAAVATSLNNTGERWLILPKAFTVLAKFWALNSPFLISGSYFGDIEGDGTTCQKHSLCWPSPGR